MIIIFIINFFIYSKQELSWLACVDLAFKNNLEIKNQELAIKNVYINKNLNKSTYYPKIYGALNYSDNFIDSGIGNKYTASINLNQSLIFSDINKINESQKLIEIEKLELEIIKAKISSDLKTTYHNLFYAKDFYNLTKQILSRREENLNMIKLRFESGRENKGVVLLSKAYYEQAKYELFLADNLIYLSKENLAKLLFIDFDFEIFENIPEPNYKETDRSIDVVYRFPEFKKSKLKEDLYEIKIKTSKALYYPSLNLNSTYSKVNNYFFPQNDNLTLSIGLSIPIFSGTYNYYNYQSALNLFEKASTEHKDLLNKKHIEYLKILMTYKELIQKLKADSSFLEAAELRAKIARMQYQNGLINFEDWDRIENDLIHRQKTHLDTKRALIIAEANFEKIQGIGAF